MKVDNPQPYTINFMLNYSKRNPIEGFQASTLETE